MPIKYARGRAQPISRAFYLTATLFSTSCGLLLLSAGALADQPETGTTSLYFHPPALENLDINLVSETSTGLSQRVGGLGFELASTKELSIITRDGNFKGFGGGAITHIGGLSFRVGPVNYSLEPLRIEVVEPWKYEIRDAEGNAWFVLEHMQQLIGDDGVRLELDNVDLAMSPWLSELIRRPDLVGTFMGSANIVLDQMPKALESANVPNGLEATSGDVCAVPVNSGPIDVELTCAT